MGFRASRLGFRLSVTCCPTVHRCSLSWFPCFLVPSIKPVLINLRPQALRMCQFLMVEVFGCPVGGICCKNHLRACRQLGIHFRYLPKLQNRYKLNPKPWGLATIRKNHPPGGWLESCSSSSLASAASACEGFRVAYRVGDQYGFSGLGIYGQESTRKASTFLALPSRNQPQTEA